MAIPNKVTRGLKAGVIGAFAFSTPRFVSTAILHSEDESNNIFGRLFTYTDEEAVEEVVQAGGEGHIAGILVNPHSASLVELGVAANGSTGELATMGIIYVEIEGAESGKIGDAVKYNPADGSLTLGEGTEIPNCTLEKHAPSKEVPNLCVIKIK